MTALLLLAACANGTDSAKMADEPGVGVAEAALRSGAVPLALRIDDAILARDPHNVAALINRGDAQTASQQFDAAAESYAAALHADASSVQARIGLARLHLADDPHAAETLFLEALQRDPRNAVALNDLGIARDLLGHHAEAQTAYRQAIGIDASMHGAQVNLALSLAMAGRAEDAVPMLRPLADAPNASRKVRDNMAAVLAMSGDRSGAQNILAQNLPPEQVDQAIAIFTAASPTSGAARSIDAAPVASATHAGGTAIVASASAAPVSVAPVSVAPVSAAPVSAAPVSAAPVSAALVSAAPVSAAPISVAPVSATLASTSLASAAPTGLAPTSLIPVSAAPAGAAPVSAAPTGVAVASANPASVAPVSSASVSAAPVSAAPASATPASAAPASATPASATQVSAAPASAAPPAGVAVASADPVTADPAVAAPITARPAGGSAMVQLSTTASQDAAKADWRRIQHHLPDLLAVHQPVFVQTENGGNGRWGVRTGGFTGMDEAKAFCSTIKARGFSCFATFAQNVPPQPVDQASANSFAASPMPGMASPTDAGPGPSATQTGGQSGISAASAAPPANAASADAAPTSVVVASAAPVHEAPAGSAPSRNAALASADQAVAPPASAAPASADAASADPLTPPPASGGTMVQLSTTATRDAATADWRRIQHHLSDLLANREPAFVQTDSAGNQRWGVRTGGFDGYAAAKGFCDTIKARGFGCFVTGS